MSNIKSTRWNEQALNRLADDFFQLFSRFEYSLKESGYLVPNVKDAIPDWIRFAEDIHELFEQNDKSEIINAKRFILEEPPKKQINRDGLIDWDSTPPDSSNQTDLLLKYIRRIRNNLFHGGKFNGRWFKPDRSGELINAAIIILKGCLEISEDVRKAYHS